MGDDFKEQERRLESLKLQNEVADERVSLAQKKALEREARQKYGRNWKRILGVVKSLKVDSETMQDLHGMGIDSAELRDLSKPPTARYR